MWIDRGLSNAQVESYQQILCQPLQNSCFVLVTYVEQGFGVVKREVILIWFLREMVDISHALVD